MTKPANKPFWLHRLWDQVVPRMPDFHTLLLQQSERVQSALAVLEEYLQSQGDSQLAEKVRDEVQAGHDLRDENLAVLYRSFITPIDREDIYTLSISIDHILDYVKNTVRELETLKVEADVHMRDMTSELGKGAEQLTRGLELLRDKHADRVANIVNTRGNERHVEKLYRKALAEMFEGSDYQRLVEQGDHASIHECLDFVVTRMKRREVYRHLSNAADRLAHAGEALRNISIKYE